MTFDEVIHVIQDAKKDFEREQKQGLLQRDLHKAEMALAGEYACDRILRAIEAREGIRVVGPHRMTRAR